VYLEKNQPEAPSQEDQPQVTPGSNVVLVSGKVKGMDRELLTLDALGLRFGTDKSSQVHDYLSFYEFFFKQIRDQELKLLEIGVYFGASLRLWKEYFPNGAIVGADINPDAKAYAEDRILIEIVDQSNIEELVALGVKHGPFDIVIEDGSHLWEHQLTTFKTLFPFLKNGGYYIAEDLHTNFGGMAFRYRGSSRISFMEYSKRLADLRVADNQIPISEEQDAFLRTYGRNIEHLTYYRRACLIKKRYKANHNLALGEAPDVSDRLLTAYPVAAVSPLSIRCHIGRVGDRQSSSGALTVLSDHSNIQGFSVLVEGPLSNSLQYRARPADGPWTDWAGCNTFVGTVGRSLDLTGFSARLAEGVDNDHTIEIAGLFRGQTAAVNVKGGEDCVASSGGRLYGMQIVIRPITGSR
jgi:hypothetical protein